VLRKRTIYAGIAGLALTAGALASSGWESAPDKPVAVAGVSASLGSLVDIVEARRGTPGPIDYAYIDERLQLVAQEKGVVGLAVGIVEDGQIRFLKGYGETVAGSGDPVTPNTVFRWASVSKGVAGDMVGLLAAEGRLSLYEPIGKYSASLRLPGGAEQKATVSDVLSHQLGLFSHAQDSRLEDGADVAMLRGTLASLNAICPPGQCHAYQNVAYDAASEVVEKVTGITYEQAVRQHLFLPLGMTSATMTRDGLVNAASWARPHVGGKGSKPVEVTDSYYRVPAAGGVNSSIKDLAIWMQAQMGVDPEVLPRDVLAAVQSPRAATPGEQARMRKFRERLGKASYGLGWRSYDYAGHTIVGHRGGVRGYRSTILFDPKRKTGVVAMWNSSSGAPSGLEFEVLDMLYRLPAKDWLGLNQAQAKMRMAQAAGAVANGD